MLQYKKAIIQKEFPFVSEVLESLQLSIDSIDKVSIKKSDENLLARSGDEKTSSFPYGRDGSYHSNNSVIYFAILNSEVTRIPSNFDDESDFQSGGRTNGKADSIGEELYKLSIDPDYIIEVRINTEEHRGESLENSHELIIYKSMSFDMTEYHVYQLKRAAQALEAELRAS